jgi:hypothetical protein
MKKIDLSHLHALEFRLSNERVRLSEAKTKKEIEQRKVWVVGIEKEIANEKKFLGIDGIEEMNKITDDDLLSELLG